MAGIQQPAAEGPAKRQSLWLTTFQGLTFFGIVLAPAVVAFLWILWANADLLRASPVDRALAEMTDLLDQTEAGPGQECSRNEPRHEHEDRLDPWGRHYWIGAERQGNRLLLTCRSAGPDGHFATRGNGLVASNDDLLLSRYIQMPSR